MTERAEVRWGRMEQVLYRDAVSAPSPLADGERFWLLDPRPGAGLIVIDSRDGSATTLHLPPGARVPPGAPGLLDVPSTATADGGVLFALGEDVYRFDSAATPAAVVRAAPVEAAKLSAARPRAVRPGLFRHMPPIREVLSPDGAWLAGVVDHDVWLRPTSGAAGRALTSDGDPDRPWDVEEAAFSPDGAWLAVTRIDRAGVPRLPLVHFTKPGTPIEWDHYSRAGDPIPRVSPVVIDVARGTRKPIDVGRGQDQFIHLVGWSRDGEVLHLLRASRLMNDVELLAVDRASGETRVLLREHSDTYIIGLDLTFGYGHALARRKHVVVLDGGGFVWTSERSGWRQLYWYDASGRLVRQLTHQNHGIERLEHVDEKGGWVYFRGRTDTGWPFRAGLYRVPLAGGNAELLLDGHSIGRIWFTRSSRAFVVEHAPSPDQPRVDLRTADGGELRSLWRADPELVRQHRWRPPEHFTAIAADGRTAIHGLLFKPIDFSPARRYPVLEYNYASPASSQIAEFPYWRGQNLAELGFIVVVVDGRGSALQSKQVRDSVHGVMGRDEVRDHVAALEQLARRRPYMDMSRVGITGHSWGGYYALRSMLLAPDIYSAAVISAPAVDLIDFRIAVEPYMGCLPVNCPDAYAQGSNTALISRLRGRLMILHGTMDDDVPLAETMKLVDALNRAGKRYELVLLPGRDHLPQVDPAWARRARQFLVEHLGKPASH